MAKPVPRTKSVVFLSTLSLRRATTKSEYFDTAMANFYPRSPCGERQEYIRVVQGMKSDFYPRSPCGERRLEAAHDLLVKGNFYPRSPCGERHVSYSVSERSCAISIHALLAESDLLLIVRERARVISIHALLAESDRDIMRLCCALAPFLSTLSLRRATTKSEYFDTAMTNFYPRSPCGERLLKNM